MSNTGVVSLKHSIDTTNAWLSEVAEAYGTRDRTIAYRVTRSWGHARRDRLPAPARDLAEPNQAPVGGGDR
ncbi:MAG: DUF2267 domain-containing protein [Streptosporangiaceae bacterium]